MLGDASNIRASRSKETGFEPLRGHPEFRDLVVAPAPLILNAPAKPLPVTTVLPNARSSRIVERPGPNDGPTVPIQSAISSRRTSPHVPIEAEDETNKRWPLWVQLTLWLTLVGASAIAGLYLFPFLK